MTIDLADLIAIHRALEMAGRDGARAELLRRFPAVRYDRVESALDFILAAPAQIPDVRRGSSSVVSKSTRQAAKEEPMILEAPDRKQMRSR
ncbi:MAG: hypothetical protein WCJ64_07380 [Rhodospirillaceae bacterium]